MQAIPLAHIIVTYFDEWGDLITHKKIQKLLYYIDAWSAVFKKEIGIKNTSLIEENFQAWVHGPVVPSAYHHFKHFRFSPIKLKYEKGEDPIKKREKLYRQNEVNKITQDLIKDVLNKYGSLSAFELERLTHSEDPWKKARESITPIYKNGHKIISKTSMRNYYKTLLVHGKKKKK